MLLAIDAGNTNLVFAVHDGKEIRAEWRAVTETTRTADEYAVMLNQLLQLQSFTFGDFATGHWQSKPRPTGKQPHDFVAGMEMWPETPGELSTLDHFQRPSAGLADRQERSG